jgi:hypothetical protein
MTRCLSLSTPARARAAAKLLLFAVPVALVTAVAPAVSTAAPPPANPPLPNDQGFAAGSYITNVAAPGRFPLVAGGKAAPLVVDSGDYPGAVRVAGDLRDDIARVTGVTPQIAHTVSSGTAPVIVGTIGRSSLTDEMIRGGTLDVSDIVGKWETSLEHGDIGGVRTRLQPVQQIVRPTIVHVRGRTSPVGQRVTQYRDAGGGVVRPHFQPTEEIPVIHGRRLASVNWPPRDVWVESAAIERFRAIHVWGSISTHVSANRSVE